MFNGLQYVLDKLQALPDEMDNFAAQVMQHDDTIEKITDLNREQLSEGEYSSGKDIYPPYRPFTVAIKKEKGQPYDKVTLRDEGDFYNELRVKNTPGKSEVYGTNWKSDKLEEKYNHGEDVIFGLAQKNIEKLRLFLFPDFVSFSQHYFNY